MKEPKRMMVTIRMTREEALMKDLLTCRCGHPENNHFDHGKNPCAHCDCEEFKERTRVGSFVR